MSSVIRPSGPLPPRVYWVRRSMLLAVVLVLVGALWWLLSGLGDPDQQRPAASKPLVSATSQPGTGGGQLTGSSGSHNGSGDGSHSGRSVGRHHRGPHHRGGHHPRKPPLAVSTGPCSPTDVAMKIAVADAPQSATTAATMSLTSLSTPACTLAITPQTMVLRIISDGQELIWTSDDCPDAVPARQVVVRADPASTYRFQWNQHKSVQGCTSPGALAGPGGYWLEAALVGADVYKAHFQIQ